VANPSALLFSGINMLRTIGLPRFGDLIAEATSNVYTEGKFLTKDVGGNSTTTEFTKRIIKEIEDLDNKKKK